MVGKSKTSRIPFLLQILYRHWATPSCTVVLAFLLSGNCDSTFNHWDNEIWFLLCFLRLAHLAWIASCIAFLLFSLLPLSLFIFFLPPSFLLAFLSIHTPYSAPLSYDFYAHFQHSLIPTVPPQQIYPCWCSLYFATFHLPPQNLLSSTLDLFPCLVFVLLRLKIFLFALLSNKGSISQKPSIKLQTTRTCFIEGVRWRDFVRPPKQFLPIQTPRHRIR